MKQWTKTDWQRITSPSISDYLSIILGKSCLGRFLLWLKRLYFEDLSALGWGQEPWALLTQIKSSTVWMGVFKKNVLKEETEREGSNRARHLHYKRKRKRKRRRISITCIMKMSSPSKCHSSASEFESWVDKTMPGLKKKG